MITNHTDLLNALVEKFKLKRYCEVGVQNPANNFDKIDCALKVGCDPEVQNVTLVFQCTSDEFFERWKRRPETIPKCTIEENKFDLFFLDGLHYADQIKRDFENALSLLSDNGIILIHDTLPENEITTCVPRGDQRIWHGDVYKWAMTLRNYPGIDFKTFNIDNGCTLVWKDSSKTAQAVLENIGWQAYQNFGPDFLNVVNDCNIDVI